MKNLNSWMKSAHCRRNWIVFICLKKCREKTYTISERGETGTGTTISFLKPRCLSTPSEKTNDVEKNKGSLTNEYKKVLSKIAEKSAEELIPLLYGKISENISTLGAAGIRVPGSAGETSGALEECGVPSLVMADGPAGIRLRQWYQVNKETGSIYEMGVLGSHGKWNPGAGSIS